MSMCGAPGDTVKQACVADVRPLLRTERLRSPDPLFDFSSFIVHAPNDRGGSALSFDSGSITSDCHDSRGNPMGSCSIQPYEDH